jgi:hypothetical protein
MAEFHKEFPPDEKVTFICPIYNTFPEIISSMMNQTHQNWELILVHDGPCRIGVSKFVKAIGDPRITYIETPKRLGNWGHYYRQFYLNEIKAGRIAKDTFAIVITNADNHHTPTFCAALLDPLLKNNSLVASYCSQMVHSYVSWGVLNCSIQLGGIDCAGVMIKKDAACHHGWRDIVGHSTDWTYFQDVINQFGADKWVKIQGCLLCHN